MASHHWFMMALMILIGVVLEYVFDVTGLVGLGR